MQAPYTEHEKTYGQEDCLILNLYKPNDDSRTGNRSSSAEARPILIWIFGGNNDASEIIPYNATMLAGQHNAIVAVVSYRLGVFGWSAFKV